MEEIIIVILSVAFISMWAYVADLHDNIRKNYKEIKSLKNKIEWYEKWTDTLFNEEDMRLCHNAGFIEGINKASHADHKVQTAKEWINSNYISVYPPVLPENITPKTAKKL